MVAAIGCFARIKSMLTERIMLSPKKAERSTDIGFVKINTTGNWCIFLSRLCSALYMYASGRSPNYRIKNKLAYMYPFD